MAKPPWMASDDEGTDLGLTFVPLPQEMLDDLKVDLSVPIAKVEKKEKRATGL